ncbi:MAG: hypothetical protein ACRC1J_02370 [Sandaracinobacteroides sp.]
MRSFHLRLLAGLLAGPMLPGAAAEAQEEAPDRVSDIDAIAEDYGTTGPEEDAEDLRVGPRRPWTLQVRAPIDWRSDLGTLDDGSRQNGLVLSPDLSVARRWRLGRLRLFTEAGALQSTVLPDARRDSAAVYGTFEAEAGNRSARFTPYAGYEPAILFRGVFASHLATLHDISLGFRRDFGATFVDLYLRRQEASDSRIERSGLGTTVIHSLPLGGRAVLNLRGEAEYRRFDWRAGARREDLRSRLRLRAIAPLANAVDLQMTADIRRLDSSQPGASFMEFVIGPALVARFGF